MVMLWYQRYCWTATCFHSEDAQFDRNGFLCHRDTITPKEVSLAQM